MLSLTLIQQEAVDNIFGPIMVIAGPGTGKTQVLSARIANILKKTDSHPKNLLALTFTESGVQAMKQRLLKEIGSDAYYTEIHTFHSFALKLLSDYEDKFISTAQFGVATPLDKIMILRKILDGGSFKELKILDDPYFYLRRIEKAISILKRENISSETLKELAINQKNKELSDPKNLYKKNQQLKPHEENRINKQFDKQIELANILDLYKSYLIEDKKRDFDDIISEVVVRLQTDEDLRLTLQENFLFILVDEYQDTNNAQNEIVKALIQNVEKPNIFIVGDDDQSIYRFQGASIANIISFTTLIEQTKLIVLKDNFRSTQTILNAALSIISKNQNRLSNIYPSLEKTFKSNVSYPNQKLSILKFQNNKIESYYISKTINDLLKQGVSPKEICIIARKNHDLDDIAEELDASDIEYEISRENNVLEDTEIKKLITLLRTIQNPFDDNLFYASLNFFCNEATSLDILKLRENARQDKTSIFNYLTNHNLPSIEKFKNLLIEWTNNAQTLTFLQFFKIVLSDLGFINKLVGSNLKIDRINALNSLFEEIKNQGRHDNTFNLDKFLDYIDLLYKYDISIKEESTKSSLDTVKLMSAHGSKGLEFEYVFLTRCIDKNWGNNNVNNDIKLPDEIVINSKVDQKERNEDERRLFYVALTRAKRKIFISYPSSINNINVSSSCNPSMFIYEIEEEFKEYTEVDIPQDEYLSHIIKKIEHVEKSHLDEKRYLSSMIDDFKLTATSLNTYLDCSEKFKLLNLLKLPITKNLKLSFGSAMHKAFELYFDDANKQNLTLERFQTLYKLALDKEVIKDEERQQLAIKGNNSLRGYFEKNNQSEVNVLKTEMDFKQRNVYLDDIHLTGKIDRIDLLDEKNKQVRIIDYKTGRSKSKNEIEGKTQKSEKRYINQLLFYKLLLELDRNFNYTPVEGMLDFIEGKDNKYAKVIIKYNESQMNEFKILVKDTMSKIRNQEFTKTTNRKLCEECAFNKICWGG